MDVVLINDFFPLSVTVETVLEQVHQAVVGNQMVRGGTGQIFNANSGLISPDSGSRVGLWSWFIQIFTRAGTSGS